MASSYGNLSFDLNFPPIEDEGELAYNFHHTSRDEGEYSFGEHHDTNVEFDEVFEEFGSNIPEEETHLDMEDPVPMIVRSSSTETVVIDFNVDGNQEYETPLLELDINELREEEFDIPAESGDGENVAAPTDTVGISQVRKRSFLSNEQRRAIYNALLQKCVNGKLKKKTTTEVSNGFSVNLRTVQRIWKQAKNSADGAVVDVSHRRTKNCGRKRVHIDLSQVHEILLHRRTTMRSLAIALDVSYSTLFRHVKEGLLRRHTNSIKPYLKEEHKMARLRFCISMLDPRSMSCEPKFVDMYNVIHIDEKWFYMTKKSETYYLLPDEEEPLCTCQSKNFIGKVMFLAAMARPRFDEEGKEVFSGKIGIFPFVTEKPAERRSRNREAGTIEIKPMTSVKRDTIRAYLIEKVIPAIQREWPREDSNKTIFIQQDNAKTHVNPSDGEFHIAASQHGFDIRLTCQPSNSPDLNILDLGFFNSIQALQQKECPRTIAELLLAVEKSFNEYPAEKLNRVFVTLQLCMREIIKLEGSNRYKIPHLNKGRLEREGRLPIQVGCDYNLVQNVRNMLAEERN